MRILTILLSLCLLSGCETPAPGFTVPLPDTDSSGSTKPEEQPDNPAPPTEAPAEKIIVGYATYWDSRMPDPTLLTHINYAFAHIKDDFESLDIKTESRLARVVALKQQNPDLKVLLSVGGWGAGNFSEMAADAGHRKKFSENCLAAVKKYGLDGIDLDWEYPTSSSAGISSSPNDTKNFNLLLNDLRSVLGDDKLLTMASSANAKYVDFQTAMKYLDFVNIMTYDMGKPPYHNAGLYKSSMTKRSCDESVELHFAAGVPYEKQVLGMPFYGHGNDVEFSSECVDYRDISVDGYTKRWDSVAMVPYLVNSSGEMILSYDDETSIGLKADYVNTKGLLGAMYWNIEADDASWTLSKAIARRIIGNGTPAQESYQVTSPYVQDFIDQVQYRDRDYSYTLITQFPGGGPGEADIPPSVVLKWQADASAGALTLRVWEEGWSREYRLPAGTSQQELLNLVPGVRYSYLVLGSSNAVVAQGSFDTTGSVHQVYFTPKVRNTRDLGGWKTLDGNTVAYRKLYRGGRVDGKYLDDNGRKEIKAAGIKAELDLREKEDVPSSSPIGKDIDFCAPGFPGGYRSMMRDYEAGIKQCFTFLAECLRNDKPILIHCAAGRDRTGTMAILTLGLLGVSEGDISKDYELTYFSPRDWSMWVEQDPDNYLHTRTQEGSFVAACKYLWDFGGATFAESVEKYLLSIGVTAKDIEDIRTAMLVKSK